MPLVAAPSTLYSTPISCQTHVVWISHASSGEAAPVGMQDGHGAPLEHGGEGDAHPSSQPSPVIRWAGIWGKHCPSPRLHMLGNAGLMGYAGKPSLGAPKHLCASRVASLPSVQHSPGVSELQPCSIQAGMDEPSLGSTALTKQLCSGKTHQPKTWSRTLLFVHRLFPSLLRLKQKDMGLSAARDAQQPSPWRWTQLETRRTSISPVHLNPGSISCPAAGAGLQQ